MWFKCVSFVCFTAPLVVSDNHSKSLHDTRSKNCSSCSLVRRLQSQNHVVEALASPLSVRQLPSPRNDTKSLVPSVTQWTLHTSFTASSFIIGQESSVPPHISDRTTFVPTTPKSSKPNSSAGQPPKPTTGFNSSFGPKASSSKTPSASTSEAWSSHGTFEGGPNTRQHNSSIEDGIQLSTSSEISLKVTTSSLIVATSILITGSSFDPLPLASPSAIVTVSSASRDTLPPVASPSQGSSTRSDLIETWYRTSSIASPTSSDVASSVVTGIVSPVASLAPYISTWTRPSQNVTNPSPPLVSNLPNTISHGSSYFSVSDTGAVNAPSPSTMSSIMSPDRSLTRPLHTSTTSPEASHWFSRSTSNTSFSTIVLPASSSIPSVVYTTVQSAHPSAVVKLSTGVYSQRGSSAALAIIMTTTIPINATSSIAHQSSLETGPWDQAWSTTPTVNDAKPTLLFYGTALSTRLVSSPGETILDASYTPAAPYWSNATIPAPVLNVTAAHESTASANNLVATTSYSSSTTSTFISASSDNRAIMTVTASFSSSSIVTGSATASPPLSPPLNASQMAGAAIAGTAGFLIAVVAAIYVARRYRNKHKRRTSKGSIYPKVAYLYDPPAGGSESGADPEETSMSGGMTGTPLDRRNHTTHANPPNYGHQDDAAAPPRQYSDPGNPFRDPEDCFECSDAYIYSPAQRPTNAVAAFSGATKAYRAAPQESPTVTEFSPAQSLRDVTWPSPMFSAIVDDRPEMASRRSILSEITSMAYNVDGYSNTLRRQPSSRFDLRSNHSLPHLRETMYTDSCRDPFEHDLLLQVDTRTGTPDSVTLFPSSITYEQPAQWMAPTKAQSNNPWASSMQSPRQVQDRSQLDRRLAEKSPIVPDATSATPERFSPHHYNQSPTTPFAASQNELSNTGSSVPPSTRALHRGWDDIKRSSIERVVPSMPDLSVLRDFPSPPPRKKTSLPLFRLKESASLG
jgi:hypothetical protein